MAASPSRFRRWFFYVLGVPKEARGGVAALGGRSRSADIGRETGSFAKHARDDGDDSVVPVAVAEVVEHLGDAPEGGERVGDSFPGNVRRAAMDRLEHGGVHALRVDVRAGGESHALSQKTIE